MNAADGVCVGALVKLAVVYTSTDWASFEKIERAGFGCICTSVWAWAAGPIGFIVFGGTLQANNQNSSAFSAGLEPGTLVEHYRIIRSLGSGGMAEVYLARDTLLGRKVALKIIHPKRIEKKDAVQRFLFEAKSTARFNHPHIITIHSVGMTDCGPYLALEYLEGQTLRERLEQERLSVKESIRITYAICDALSAAHKQGLLHRDLKPENVMLVKDGRLRVLDFGLSLLVDGKESDQTEQAQDEFRKIGVFSDLLVSNQKKIKGTPAYMAPEQWRAEELSPKTDIWSLGVMLCEMLMGRHPYHHVDQIKNLASLVLDDSIVPQPAAQRHIPIGLLELISRCVAKEPDLRPTAQELVLELSYLLSGGTQQTLTDISPFRGLVPFEEEHGSLYFGREAQVSSFVERLRSEPILPVVGLSGAGKSSFVKAGVIPRLRDRGPLTLIQLRPGRNPFLTLASRLVQAWQRPTSSTGSMGSVGPTGRLGGPIHAQRESSAESIGTPKQLAQTLYDKPQLLGLWLHRLADRHRMHVILFVDQTEELWALPREADWRDNSTQESQGGLLERFMKAISTAADDPQLPVRVILTLREEFISRLVTSGRVREALSRIVVLRQPSSKTLLDILIRSVKSVGYRFEDYLLAQDMVSEVENSQSAFSLIQFAGLVLWQNRDQQRKVLTRAAFENMGGVTGALVQHADGVLKGLSATEENIARLLLIRLVTENKTKRIVSYQDLQAGLPESAKFVLDRLIESRLVIITRKTPEVSQTVILNNRVQTKASGDACDQDTHGDCELVHEALIVSWDRLSKWLDESSEELRLLNQIEQAALLWDKRGRQVDELWGTRALKEVEALRESELESSPLTLDFKRASERHIRLGRFRRTASVGSIVVALFAAVWGGQHFLKGRLCTGAKDQIESVWSDKHKQELERAFTRAGLAYAHDTVLRVHKILDAYANEWTAHYTTACEATHIKGEQSEEVLDLRMRCLRDRLGEFRALVRVFDRADAKVVQKAVQASSSLTGISVCGDEKSLRAPYLPPKTPEEKKTVAFLRDKLTEVVAAVKTGKYQEGLRLIRPLETKANSIDYQPIRAQLLFQLGKLLYSTGKYKDAEKTLYMAAEAAGKSKNDKLVSNILNLLLFVVGHAQGRPEDGLLIARDAQILVELSGGDDALRALLFSNIGSVYFRKIEYDKALEYYRKSLKTWEKTRGPGTLDSATPLNNMAAVFVTQGEYDKALAYHQKALAIRENVLGPEHPDVALSLHNIGVAYAGKQAHEKALEYYKKSLAIMEKSLGRKHPYVASSLYCLGEVYRKQGHYELAIEYLQRAHTMWKNMLGSSHPKVAQSLSGMGSVWLARGMLLRALELFEQAVYICEKATCEKEPLGRAFFGAAQALVAIGGENQRAYKFATRAREEFGKIPHLEKQRQEVEAFLRKSHKLNQTTKTKKDLPMASVK